MANHPGIHSLHTRLLAIGAASISLCLSDSAQADTLNVPADYATIQAAINAAVNGDEVLIAPGTYSESLTINNKAITMRGSGGAAATVIMYEFAGGILDMSNVESDTVLDGLTFGPGHHFITTRGVVEVNGSPTIMNCIFRDNFVNSALHKTGTGDMVVTDCQFIDNEDSDAFGGGALEISQGTATITGCTFTGNTAGQGGALYIRGGLVSDCTFDLNSAWETGDGGGGAIKAQGSGGVQIDNCTFDSNGALNKGGAVLAEGDLGPVSVTNCQFTGNSAVTGGGLYLEAGATATGCTFTSNTCSGAGGGLAVENASATDCTFTSNESTGNGGAMHALGTTSVLANCDASENIAAGIGGGLHVAAGATATMNDSLLCDNVPDQIGAEGVLTIYNVFACGQVGDPIGACCLPQGGCTLLTEETCLAVGGTYQGDGTDCETAECPEPCPGDTNGDGVVNVVDLLAVLGAWGSCF